MRIRQKPTSIIKIPKWLADTGLWIKYFHRKLKDKLKTNIDSIWLRFLDFSAKRIEIPRKRFGSAYGGWTVCPLNLNKDAIIYSLGIGEDITFDLAIIEKFRCQVFAFDPTPRSIEWLKLQNLPPQFSWHKIGVACYDGKAKFFPPENPAHISHTLLNRPQTTDKAIAVEVNRLPTLLKRFGHTHIDILKMDIEGAEYEVIGDLLSTGIKPTQILVEFHHFFDNISVFKTIHTTLRLYLSGYRIFALSKSGHEYSFIKHSFLKSVK